MTDPVEHAETQVHSELSGTGAGKVLPFPQPAPSPPSIVLKTQTGLVAGIKKWAFRAFVVLLAPLVLPLGLVVLALYVGVLKLREEIRLRALLARASSLPQPPTLVTAHEATRSVPVVRRRGRQRPGSQHRARRHR